MACLASKTVKRDADYADQALKNADKNFWRKRNSVRQRASACVRQRSIFN
jgi:hypothetical protein